MTPGPEWTDRKKGITVRPVIRRAHQSDAQVVHGIMSAIPWISVATKTEDGFIRTQEACARGEIYLLTLGSIVAAMIILRKDALAASCGYNIWSIPLIATVESQRRKGHARRLVRKAKKIVRNGVIQAHVENDKSLSLLVSEGFVPVDGKSDASGHPLYEWDAN
jgi:hypothetical protein